MPPRLRIPARRLRGIISESNGAVVIQCRHATAVATTPAPPIHESIHAVTPPHIQRYPPTQPPSYKQADLRKTQLHRQYQSLIKSTPLMLIFQHNNLTAAELNGIRRELGAALRKIDETEGTNLSSFVKLQVIQTGIFASAMNVIEHFDASTVAPGIGKKSLTHGLSANAYKAGKQGSKTASSDLAPLLKGPMVLLTLPTVSPAYLKSCLTILSPSEKFPAPKRRTNPTYHEPAVQSGLSKLMLLGARAEGRVFDQEGAKWIGGIEGGLTGLRSQLVFLLQQFGIGVTSTLEAASKSLYFSLETRRSVLEEEENPKPKEEEKPAS